MTRCIGNGEDTSLWYDPWMKEGILADQLGRDNLDLQSSSTWKVNKLIQTTHGSPPSLLPSLLWSVFGIW